MRVAQLQDDLEKRNTFIKRITQENRKLQVCSEFHFSCSNSCPFQEELNEVNLEEESEIVQNFE